MFTSNHYYKVVVLVGFMLIQARVTLEEKNSIKKMPPIDGPVSKPVVHFLN